MIIFRWPTLVVGCLLWYYYYCSLPIGEIMRIKVVVEYEQYRADDRILMCGKVTVIRERGRIKTSLTLYDKKWLFSIYLQHSGNGWHIPLFRRHNRGRGIKSKFERRTDAAHTNTHTHTLAHVTPGLKRGFLIKRDA